MLHYGTCVEVALSFHCIGCREIKLRPLGVGANVFAHHDSPVLDLYLNIGSDSVCTLRAAYQE